jgi:hypothetical protein
LLVLIVMALGTIDPALHILAGSGLHIAQAAMHEAVRQVAWRCDPDGIGRRVLTA